MKQTYEYIVLGLGGIGSAAAYWLARRVGAEVLGLEQFELGHLNGGSHDHSRIIRLSYHTPDYVRLAQRAYQSWAEVEAEAQEPLILKTGGLDLGRPHSAIPLRDYSESLQACKVPFETLDAAEIMHRWPQFRLSDDIQGLYQSESGIAPAAKATATHQRLARAHGATLLERQAVSSLRTVDGEMEVVAGGVTYRCRKLVITAGAWSNQALAHFGLHLPLTVTQEQVNYFASPHLADFSPERFPVWIWMDEPCFYGFPLYGEAAVKVAQDVGGDEVTVESRTFEPNPATLDRVERFVKTYLPTAHGPLLYAKTCLYTMPPDRDFVLDQIPGYDNGLIAIGAGHAFKFASVLGQILSELAIEGTTESNLDSFRMSRPILQQDNPVKSFMV
ncbi:MAG: N-methyl-L-tryptophan oxidase [Anaerolineae bacterium]|nr:N-methyl-L-tryptophan oxidase [Anaerolineae bacterium]